MLDSRSLSASLSEANTWALARAEWDLHEIYFVDENTTCLCTHYPIKEVCVLHNRRNGNFAEVGNVCVNKFMGLPSKIIFDGLKRVSKDDTKALNADASHYAYRKGWVNDWEYGFLNSTRRKQALTGRQLAKRQEINRRVLLKMKRS
jgi:hypothetical protein